MKSVLLIITDYLAFYNSLDLVIIDIYYFYQIDNKSLHLLS